MILKIKETNINYEMGLTPEVYDIARKELFKKQRTKKVDGEDIHLISQEEFDKIAPVVNQIREGEWTILEMRKEAELVPKEKERLEKLIKKHLKKDALTFLEDVFKVRQEFYNI